MCDDEWHILRLIEVNLTRQGHEVVCCDSVHRALELAHGSVFDFAVLDSTLPDSTSEGLEERLRETPGNSQLRVIVLKAP